MATITTYATRQHIIDRLGDAGIVYAANNSGSGTTTEAEMVAHVDRALSYAAAIIDNHLNARFETVPISQDDSSLNTFLKETCVNIALHHLCGRMGADIPASIADFNALAREDLRMIKRGTLKVQGLTYPTDGKQQQARRRAKPKTINPKLSRY